MASTGPSSSSSSSGGSAGPTTAANSAAANGPDTNTIIRAAAAPLIMANMSPTQRPEATNSNNYEPLDKTTSNTLKRNPKMEMCKTDLLKLLGYLEGELQARDIVIATLKSEKLKQLLNSRYRSGTSDPHSALSRDTAITCGSSGSQNNHMEQLATTLENLVGRQRYLKSHMANLLKHSELRHRNVVRELEEERRKNQPIAALGDGSDSALEKERLRLMKELELERQEKKRLEGEVKVVNDVLQEEKNRHKQIVLVLLAERKKIIMKYIEERKRSEDLAQILSEEKVRVNSMAESLEEETKKATLMEAEMEKQAVSYDIERSQYRQSTASKEKKFNELQAENEKLRAEIEQMREQLMKRGGVGVTPPPPPAKPANLAAMPGLRATAANAVASVKGAVLGAGTPMVSSKVVQPTATVSSVPVSGPTTGIARSVQPGQALRGAAAFVAASSIESAASQDSTAAQVNYPYYPSHSTLI